MKTKNFTQSGVLLAIAAISGVLCFFRPASAQEVDKKDPGKPDVKIKVNKEYDNKGNVTRYDSTYSYSWSGNGQIPADADSLLKGFSHHFYFGNSADSVFNGMGFEGLFGNDPFFSQPFSRNEKQFEEFFNRNLFPADSSFEDNPADFFNRDFREMIKQQQQRMEQFYKQLYFDSDSLKITPGDTIPSRKTTPKGNADSEKQNYLQSKKTDKTISV
jgi:hypothetical protein